MGIASVTGVNAYRQAAGAARQTAQRKAEAPTGRQLFDRVELSLADIAKAEKRGYIEVSGRRFDVGKEMAAELRDIYAQQQADKSAILAQQAAEQSARSAEQQAGAMKHDAKSMAQAIEIARRIAAGGQVPPQDEEFLMNYSQEMYLSAKMMALMAEEHEKHDTVLEEDESADPVAETAIDREASQLASSIASDLTLDDAALQSEPAPEGE